MNPSCNLFLIGPTGAGKTSIGEPLAARLKLPFLDLDQEMEHATGMAIATLFDREGEAGFRQRERHMLEACSRRRGVLLATGAGVVLDPANRHILAARGYVVWLQLTVALQWQRLRLDTSRPLLADTDRHRTFATMAAVRTPLYAEIADLIVAPPAQENESVAAGCERCFALIDRHWHRKQVA